ncbi:MAG: M24 family metallopeptidase [Candidatus Baldrarchaeia archaeon]
MPEGGVFRKRVGEFQKLLRENGIDAAMIRTLSSFIYFTGVKWLRPALLIPADGDPIAFIFEYEAEEFRERTWIEDVRTWRRTPELMKSVTGTIKERKCKRVGFDYSVERDSYVLFFELFKTLNPRVEVVDVHGLIMKLRMVKDTTEIEYIQKASNIAVKGMSSAVDAVDVNVSEVEIAAEAYYAMMKSGSEHPHVYVNIGPRPRVHAEPRADIKVKPGDTVNIVVGADYMNYHSNMSRTVFVGSPSKDKRRALEAVIEAQSLAMESLKPGVKLIDVEKKIRELIEERGIGKYYVEGFAHGVGLLVEEDPITTIVVKHRQYEVVENMVLAFIHAPLTVPGVGSVKCEDTFVIRADGTKRFVEYDYELIK